MYVSNNLKTINVIEGQEDKIYKLRIFFMRAQYNIDNNFLEK